MERESFDRTQIGQRLRMVRQTLHLSQQQLGEKLAVSGCYLSMVENGLRYPSEQLLRLLCLTEKVDRQWLECGRGVMFCAQENGSASDSHYDRQLMKLAIERVGNLCGSRAEPLPADLSDLVLDCYEELLCQAQRGPAARKTAEK